MIEGITGCRAGGATVGNMKCAYCVRIATSRGGVHEEAAIEADGKTAASDENDDKKRISHKNIDISQLFLVDHFLVHLIFGHYSACSSLGPNSARLAARRAFRMMQEMLLVTLVCSRRKTLLSIGSVLATASA